MTRLAPKRVYCHFRLWIIVTIPGHSFFRAQLGRKLHIHSTVKFLNNFPDSLTIIYFIVQLSVENMKLTPLRHCGLVVNRAHSALMSLQTYFRYCLEQSTCQVPKLSWTYCLRRSENILKHICLKLLLSPRPSDLLCLWIGLYLHNGML